MKTKNLLFIMVAAIVMIGSASCKKEDPLPPRTEWDNIVVKMSQSLEKYNETLAELLFQEINDTIWPLDADGIPKREKDPITGEWLHNGTNPVYNDFANAARMSQNYVDDCIALLHKNLWEWQNEHPHERGFTSHPYDNCEVIIEVINGSTLQEDLQKLNQLGDLSIKHPNKSPMEIIRDEVRELAPKAKEASLIHLQREVRKGDVVVAAAFAKHIESLVY